jgi:hypothetical protein
VEQNYVVECFWPSVRPWQVERGAARIRDTAGQLSSEGRGVVFAGSIFVPGDETVFYLLDGVSAEAVGEACARAAIAFERIVESVTSLDLTRAIGLYPLHRREGDKR